MNATSRNNVYKEPVTDDSEEANRQKNMSLTQLRPFMAIAIPFFRSDKAAACSLMGLVILTLINSAMMILFSYVKRDIFDGLNQKNQEKFYQKIGEFFLILTVAVPMSVIYNYLRLRLALYWRKALTLRVLDKYYANRNFYVIECCHDIDNPDQRIAEDLNEFTSTSLEFFFIAFDSIMNLFSFSVVLYRIFPMLFWSIILYAIIGTFVTAKLGRSLVGLYYHKLQKEANFRFGLIRTRENAEGIAFYDSEATLEKINLWSLFQDVLENQLCIIKTQRNLEFFTTSYDYFTFLIPYVVVAPLYFRGEVDLGAITQSSEAFYYVRTSFSLIVSYFEKLSAFSAGKASFQCVHIDFLQSYCCHRVDDLGCLFVVLCRIDTSLITINEYEFNSLTRTQYNTITQYELTLINHLYCITHQVLIA
jgi:putative ATP-binding cassette transporter